MTIIAVIWILLQVLIGYNLFLPFILFLFYRPSRADLPDGPESDYAIIVTAYEQVDSLPPVITSLLRLKYSNYLIYIVADKCDITSLNFNDNRVILVRV